MKPRVGCGQNADKADKADKAAHLLCRVGTERAWQPRRWGAGRMPLRPTRGCSGCALTSLKSHSCWLMHSSTLSSSSSSRASRADGDWWGSMLVMRVGWLVGARVLVPISHPLVALLGPPM